MAEVWVREEWRERPALGLVDRNRTGSSRAHMDAQTGDQSNRRVRMPFIGGVPNIRQYSRLNRDTL